jgi:hypothetical protein
MKITKETLKQLVMEELKATLDEQAELDEISMGVSTAPQCNFTDLYNVIANNFGQDGAAILVPKSMRDGTACNDVNSVRQCRIIAKSLAAVNRVLKQYEEFYK